MKKTATMTMMLVLASGLVHAVQILIRPQYSRQTQKRVKR